MQIILFMIVKDESKVIERCLRTIKPYIHGWCIADTGSTDNTIEIIQRVMQGLPGEVFERPWVDFAHNRNESLARAKELFPEADYLVTLDADEVLASPNFNKLDSDAHPFKYIHGSLEFERISVISAKQPWKFKDVLHEYLDLETPHSKGEYVGVVRTSREGARSSDPLKYEKDAEILRKELEKDPTNTRYQFYFAQSLRDAGKLEDAYQAYGVRATMGGWSEEVWQSYYQRGIITESLGRDGVKDFMAAYEVNPKRAEAPGRLARLYRAKNKFNLAYLWANAGIGLEVTPNLLFAEPSYYKWICKDEAAIAAYWTGKFAIGAELNKELLASADLPQEQHQRITENLRFCTKK